MPNGLKNTIYSFTCPNCGSAEAHLLGAGEWTPITSLKTKVRAMEGGMGEEWRGFVTDNPEGGFDCARALYVCSCGFRHADYRRDYYVPPDSGKKITIFVKSQRSSDYKCIRHYMHSCPACGGEMNEAAPDKVILKCTKCGCDMEMKKEAGESGYNCL